MLHELTNRMIAAALASLLVIALHTVSARADHGNDDDGDAEIHGIIESLPSSGLIGDWTVSGRTVHVTSATFIKQEHGSAAVGAPVEVKGDRQSDNSIDARRVQIEGPGSGNGGGGDDNGGGGSDDNGGSPTGGHAKFFGTIESLPQGGLAGTWTVSQRTIRVSSATVIEREHGVTPAVGSYVEVEGAQLQDGSIQATKVEVKTAGSAPGSGPSSGSGYIEIRAKVDALPVNGLVGEWTVGGRSVFVTDATRIKKASRIREGATVEVRGNQRSDGAVDANRVDAKGSKGGGAGTSSFYGTIESMPSAGVVGQWVVNGRTVFVDGSTFVDQEHGQAAVGALVEVKGAPNSTGSFVATKIEVKTGTGGAGSSGYIEFRGTVERLPASGVIGDWMVSGRIVHVSSSTTIRENHGPARIGGRVEIEGNQRSDGSVDAKKVGTED